MRWRRHEWKWLLPLIVLAAFGLRLFRLDTQDIWWDEARNLSVASQPLAQIAGDSELDIHPPVYFYLLHGWLGLSGQSGRDSAQGLAFAARFLSLGFGVLLTPLMGTLGQRVGGRWTGLGAAAAAAFLPFLLGEAQETRMYTATLTWLAVAGVALLRVEGDAGHHAGAWLLCSLFSALALLTHYAAGFALVSLWGWALGRALLGAGTDDHSVRERWRRLRPVLLAGLLTALLCLPALPIALRQLSTYRNPNLAVPPVAPYLAELAHVYGVGEHMDIAAARPWQWALASLLIGGWLLVIVRRRSGDSAAQRIPPLATRHVLFTLVWAVLPLGIYYLVIRDRSTFASRYISVALPGWLLLGGLALRGWASLGRWPAALAGAGLAVILAPGVRGDLLDTRFYREDTRGLVAWLRTHTGPSDLILVDQRYPFGLYYPRWNDDADGLPPPEPAGMAPAQYLFVDINTLDNRLTALGHGRQRVFWVRWFESDTDPRGAVPFLLEKFGALLGEQAFRGYTVSSYAIAPDATFELAPGLEEIGIDFGNQVRLAGAAFGGSKSSAPTLLVDTRQPAAPADGAIWATLRWQRLPDADKPLKAKLILEDADGSVIAQDDRPILNDRHLAPPHWGEADKPLGVYLARPQPAMPPGTYTVKLAVYDPTDLKPLATSGPDARGSAVTLGQMQIVRASRPPAVGQLPLDAAVSFAWGGLRLLGRGPLPVQIAPGDQLSFSLFWQAEKGDLPDLQAQLALAPGGALATGGAGAVWKAPLVEGYATSAWQAGEVVRGRQHLRIDPDTLAGVYQLSLRLADAWSAATSPAVTLGQVTVAGRPHVYQEPANIGERSEAQIGAFARLLGFDLGVRKLTAGGELALTLYWQALGASEQPVKVFAQLLDGSGVLRGQRDQEPGDGAFATPGWVAGEVLTDTYRIALPAGMPAGDYRLMIGMYSPTSGARLPVTNAAGAPLGDALELAIIEVR